MAKSQENDTTILLWLERYEVGTVTEGERKTIVEVRAQGGKSGCPYCSLVNLCRHGSGRGKMVFHTVGWQVWSDCWRY